jgi:hypothetical protein
MQGRYIKRVYSSSAGGGEYGFGLVCLDSEFHLLFWRGNLYLLVYQGCENGSERYGMHFSPKRGGGGVCQSFLFGRLLRLILYKLLIPLCFVTMQRHVLVAGVIGLGT